MIYMSNDDYNDILKWPSMLESGYYVVLPEFVSSFIEEMCPSLDRSFPVIHIYEDFWGWHFDPIGDGVKYYHFGVDYFKYDSRLCKKLIPLEKVYWEFYSSKLRIVPINNKMKAMMFFKDEIIIKLYESTLSRMSGNCKYWGYYER